MSPIEDNTSHTTTATGSIDYAYYDKRARMAKSRAFGGFLHALGSIVRKPSMRLSMPAPLLGNGPAASPCS